MTVEDPVTLEHPYSYRRVYRWRPDVRPQEYVCEENIACAREWRDGGQMRHVYVVVVAAALSLAGAIAQADPPDLTGVWLLSVTSVR